MLVLEGGFLWGRDGYVTRQGETLVAHGPAGERRVYTTGTPMQDPNIPVQTAYLSVVLDGPVAFSTGNKRELSEVQALLRARKAAYREKNAKYGTLQELLCGG